MQGWGGFVKQPQPLFDNALQRVVIEPSESQSKLYNLSRNARKTEKSYLAILLTLVSNTYF